MGVITSFLFFFFVSSSSLQAQMYFQTKYNILSTNVGVNTNSPTAKLHIKKPLGNAVVIGGEGENTIYVDNTDPFLVESEFSNASHGTTPDGTNANFIIKPSGYVGINTYNPTKTLHVEGTSYFKKDADFGDNVDITGDVSITKTTTIGQGLSVGGNTAIAASLAVSGSADVTSNLDVGQNLSVSGTTVLNNTLVVRGGNSNSAGINEMSLRPDGFIRAREVRVNMDNIPFPDYVFDEDYNLMTLKELKSFIKNHGHLPNIPSAEEVKATGEISLKEMNLRLIEKVEELTLYILEQEERLVKLENLQN